jgi:predicted DNA-binding protein
VRPKGADPERTVATVVNNDALWCRLPIMAQSEKVVRQSVTLPSPVAKRVRALARRENRSSSRVLVELIEAGLDAREQEKKTFFELADRLATSSDVSEQKRLKRELARMTYGE